VRAARLAGGQAVQGGRLGTAGGWGFMAGPGQRGMHRVDVPGQGQVLAGEAARVVGGQAHVHAVVDVEPLRVVVVPLRMEGDLGHEAEGLVEIGKAEAAADGQAPSSSCQCGSSSRLARRVEASSLSMPSC
jgi:hypothetical protein